MSTIGKNDELLKYLSLHKLYILDSELFKIDIFEKGNTPSIELYFKLSNKSKLLKVKFTNVKEYSFYYRSDHYFYNVERCKFFKKDDLFYLSVDPYNEAEEINDEDQDFILCNEIEGYIQ